MSSNYLHTAIVAGLVIVLIMYLIRRNKKDQDIVERDLILGDTKPGDLTEEDLRQKEKDDD